MDVLYNLRAAGFPWMTEADWQDHKQRWLHGNVKDSLLIMPYYRFVPFQILRESNGTDVGDITWTITDIATGTTYDMMALLPGGQTTLKVRTNGELDWIYYDGTQAFTAYIPGGVYYSTLSDGVNTWYSEAFKFFCSVDPADANSGIGVGLDQGLVIEHHAGWDDFVQTGGLGNVLP